ncbi:hypothetical protein RB594_009465 [Gaeumannomyces avenae]
MEATAIFRQGIGSMMPRPPQQHTHPNQQFHPQFQRPPVPQQFQYHAPGPGPAPSPARARQHNRDDSDGNSPSQRIAHTLTACCRCRQRKTRCDPTLPRCLPCERSGSICEYYDTTKGKKINRQYVVKLQGRVRQLEAELAQFTNDDDYPRNSEDMVRPGGLVRLDERDETPRYLGPSSGIAMTRLLMEEAKRYTESNKISELIPEVRSRRLDRSNRMQSVVSMGGSISGPSGRKKSYPMVSAYPAEGLPTRPMAGGLMDVFNQRAQIFQPSLHEVTLAKDLDDVYAGEADAHQNFMVRMVLAVALQKLDTQWAGLADGYYLAAMQYFEDVVRTKDLRTVQCLILIAQYSTLTPTRTAVYYIIGLATRICQQLGLGDEKTITNTNGCAQGDLDPLTLDMRRRLSWIVTAMEYGLAHSMGRPSGFAKGNDFMDVDFFDAHADEDITSEGIKDGPLSKKKLAAIHFCKMRVLQAEIRRVLYEKKRHEPRDENHSWFAQMEQKMQEWLDASPQQPAWCRPWFTGKYHTMVVALYRPSPQVPKPSGSAALRCAESAAFIMTLSSQQVKKSAVDITWIFLLTVYMSLNTLLWSVSYAEVRKAHPREKLEELVATCLETIDQCAERWPGTAAASQHYSNLARACLQSYEQKEDAAVSRGFAGNFGTPSSTTDTNSPSASDVSGPSVASTAGSQALPQHSQQQQQQQASLFVTPQFGNVFNSQPEASFNFGNPGFIDDGFQQRHPQFRTGSIFYNPSSDGKGRRPSYFPPEFVQDEENSRMEDQTGPGPSPSTAHHEGRQPSPQHNALPTPPESLGGGQGGFSNGNSLSPAITMASDTRSVSPTPTMAHRSPPAHMTPVATPAIKFTPHTPQQQHQEMHGHPTPQSTPQQTPTGPVTMPSSRGPTFAIPPLPQQGRHAHHHPPANVSSSWFSPPPPLISPFAFTQQQNNTAFHGNAQSFGDPGVDTAFMSALPPGGFGGAGMNSMGLGPGGAPGGGMSSFGQGGHFAANGFVNPMRHGSLTQEQLSELMGVLEQDGMGEINQLLNMGVDMVGVENGNGGRW